MRLTTNSNVEAEIIQKQISHLKENIPCLSVGGVVLYAEVLSAIGCKNQDPGFKTLK